MLHAIIDIGSSTIRMAIYQIKTDDFEILMKRKHIVGLASYVVAGEMTEEGIDRAVAILSEYKRLLDSFAIDRIHAFTTAALRNAANSAGAVAEIRRRTGIDIKIMSGDEEAEYDFVGATKHLADHSGVIIDIGGGSTEIIAFEQRKISRKLSLSIGALSLGSRNVAGTLPTKAETSALYNEAAKFLDSEAETLAGIKAKNLIGLGGTLNSASSVYNLLYHEHYRHNIIEAAHLSDIIDKFSTDGKLTPELSAIILKAAPDRLHTLIPGLVIADLLAQLFSAEQIIYSNSGVREGYIYREILKLV